MDHLGPFLEWEPSGDYLDALEHRVRGPEAGPEALWRVCDWSWRRLMALFAAMVTIGGGLLAMWVKALAEVLEAGENASGTPVWALIAVLALGLTTVAWWAAKRCLDEARDVSVYYCEQARHRWLEEE